MKTTFQLLILVILLAACGPRPMDTPTPQVLTSQSVSNTPSLSPTFTITPSTTPTKTITPSPSPTLTLTPTATATPIPTYAVLRGEVNVAHVSCFYGPSKAYLYKYGLVGGSNLEIIGQNLDTGYLKVQAIGGSNPCWMNSEWMNIKGDPHLIQPIAAENVSLPMSPYYGPPSGQNASRDGDVVTVSWNWFGLRAGDDSEQNPYLVEAWVCQDGEFTFVPLGVWENIFSITDEAGCEEGSHARLYAVEKHGYTPYVEIPWPPHPNKTP